MECAYPVQVTCLIELVQNGAAVAHHLWVLLFPIVWSSLKKEQQVRCIDGTFSHLQLSLA